jgi:hypothetical protein
MTSMLITGRRAVSFGCSLIAACGWLAGVGCLLLAVGSWLTAAGAAMFG